MPLADRPREKLLRHGTGALGDAELLALLIRSGTARHSAIDLARQLLERHGALSAVLASPLERLGALPGLGIAKAASLVAAMELARRAQFEAIDRQTLLDKPQAVRHFLALLLAGRDQEAFVVMFLDSQNRLIRCDEMFHGTLNQTAVYPRDIVRRALDLHSAALILAHNHPSGLAEPSQADVVLTGSLKAALAAVGVSVLDHLIVAGGHSYSFAEKGRL
ncbi:MAG: DNA repair protein RadC [Lautropia sp.]